AFTPNNAALAACTDKSVLTWNTVFTVNQPLPPDFLKPLQTFTHEGATDTVFAADSATLFASSLDKSVKVFKVASDTPTKNFPHPAEVYSVAFHQSGTQLATCGRDGKVRLFDLVKGAPIREINAHVTPNATQIYMVVWSPDGKQIVTAALDNSLK